MDQLLDKLVNSTTEPKAELRVVYRFSLNHVITQTISTLACILCYRLVQRFAPLLLLHPTFTSKEAETGIVREREEKGEEGTRKGSAIQCYTYCRKNHKTQMNNK